MLLSFTVWFQKVFIADTSPGIIKILVKLVLYPFYLIAYGLNSFIDWIVVMPTNVINGVSQWVHDVLKAIGDFLW